MDLFKLSNNCTMIIHVPRGTWEILLLYVLLIVEEKKNFDLFLNGKKGFVIEIKREKEFWFENKNEILFFTWINVMFHVEHNILEKKFLIEYNNCCWVEW